jgi:hypothetical protein
VSIRQPIKGRYKWNNLRNFTDFNNSLHQKTKGIQFDTVHSKVIADSIFLCYITYFLIHLLLHLSVFFHHDRRQMQQSYNVITQAKHPHIKIVIFNDLYLQKAL